MSKDRKTSLFWTSYSDLMTSLFFTLLVLFIVTIVGMSRAVQRSEDTDTLRAKIVRLQEQLHQAEGKVKATENEIRKIRDINESVKLIDPQWFEYREQYKKHILTIDVSFPTGSSDMTMIPRETRDNLRSAGESIENFLTEASHKYGTDVEYLLIIEGQASKDSYSRNYELSYERALALYKYFDNNAIHLNRYNCEVLICGSGTEGTLREQPDDSKNTKNQRFLIHILPKPGIIK